MKLWEWGQISTFEEEREGGRQKPVPSQVLQLCTVGQSWRSRLSALTKRTKRTRIKSTSATAVRPLLGCKAPQRHFSTAQYILCSKRTLRNHIKTTAQYIMIRRISPEGCTWCIFIPFFAYSLSPQMVFPHFLSTRISSHRFSVDEQKHFTVRNSSPVEKCMHVLIKIKMSLSSKVSRKKTNARRCRVYVHLWECMNICLWVEIFWECHWCKNHLVDLWWWPHLFWKTDTVTCLHRVDFTPPLS